MLYMMPGYKQKETSRGDVRILVNVWDGDHGRIGQNRPEISKKNKQNNKRMIRRFYKIKLYNV